MATFSRYTTQIQDDLGNLILDPTVVVRRMIAGMPREALYSDRTGLSQIQNPAAFSDGVVTFCAAGGLFELTITAASRPGFSRVLSEVAIGTMREFDFGSAGMLTLEPDAVVPNIAGRAAYDDELRNFSVLVESDSTHSNLPILYYKQSERGGQLAGSLGTPIGNMTGGGNLAAAFDGTTVQAGAASASLLDSASDGTIGKDWGSGVSRVVSSATLYGPSDLAVARNNSNVATSVNAKLQGSNNGSDWTDLDTQATGTSSAAVIVFSPASTTAYRYHRILVPAASSSSDKMAAEVTFYEKGDWSSGLVFAAARLTAALSVTINGGGAIIQTGDFHDQPVPFASVITAWRITADGVGSIEIDVRNCAYDDWPPDSGDSITAGNPIALSSAQKAEDTVLSGWSTTLEAGQHLGFTVLSCDGITKATLTLFLRRT